MNTGASSDVLLIECCLVTDKRIILIWLLGLAFYVYLFDNEGTLNGCFVRRGRIPGCELPGFMVSQNKSYKGKRIYSQ